MSGVLQSDHEEFADCDGLAGCRWRSLWTASVGERECSLNP